MQVNSVVQVRTVLLTSEFGSSTRGERHNFFYDDHTIWPLQRAAHLVMFKISIGRDPKNPTISLMIQIQLSTQWQRTQLSVCMVQCQPSTDSFSKSLISQDRFVIHSPAPFPVWGFIMTMVIVISFARERKLHQLIIHLNSSKRNQTEWYNIIYEKWLI